MKEQKRKEKKEILVIDKGVDVDVDDVEHNTAFCCRGAFMPFR